MAFQQGQVVEGANGEVMPRIPIAATSVQRRLERVRKSGEDVDLVVDFMRPGVVGFEGEMLVVPPQLRLQGAVLGEENVGQVAFVLVGRRGRENPGLVGVGIGRIEIDSLKSNAGLRMLHLVAGVIDRQDSIPRHFLLHAEEPIRRIRIFRVGREDNYVLVRGQQGRIQRWIRDGWDCAAEDGEIEEGVRDACIRGHVVRQRVGRGLHGHIEQPAVAVDDCLSFAEWVIRKADAGSKIAP